MKIAVIVSYDVNRVEELAHAVDRLFQTLPKGVKVEAGYVLTGPLPGFTAGSAAIAIFEAESAEAVLAIQFAIGASGARSWAFPAVPLGAEVSRLAEELRRRSFLGLSHSPSGKASGKHDEGS